MTTKEPKNRMSDEMSRTTSIESIYRRQAQHYLLCEQLLVGELYESKAVWAGTPLPYRLLGQAIELELKARHIESRTRSTLQLSRAPYARSLRKLYDELPLAHRSLTPADYQVLRAADLIYNDMGAFDYLTERDAGLASVLIGVEELTQKILGSNGQASNRSLLSADSADTASSAGGSQSMREKPPVIVLSVANPAGPQEPDSPGTT